MQYYTFELDDESKELCTLSTPYGFYCYCWLPMGVKQASNVAQEIMETIFRDMDNIDDFISNLGIFSNSYSSHLSSVATVLERLEKNRFTVNPLKCEWAVQETDWLGYWLTPAGFKPWNKKIGSILRLKAPKTIKQVRLIIGAVTFYRNMWPRQSHTLAPLTELTGTG